MDQGLGLRHLLRDLFIILASIILAVVLVKTEAIKSFIDVAHEYKTVSIIIAGAFFTSIFTLAPASVGLVALNAGSSPLIIASIGAIGAACVDLLIVSFIRKDISEDLNNLSKTAIKRHFIEAFHFGFLKWAALIIGLLIVATPLPDELGLFFIGLSKIRGWILPVIFYVAHFLGIYALLSIAQTL